MTAKSVPSRPRAPLTHRRYPCGRGAGDPISANIYAGPSGLWGRGWGGGRPSASARGFSEMARAQAEGLPTCDENASEELNLMRVNVEISCESLKPKEELPKPY